MMLEHYKAGSLASARRQPAARTEESGALASRYDAVIIGAGIGGLTCGSYLAKAGMKVLVVEKHYVPGGYCSSFWRKGYYFDSGAHYVGGCRRAGQVGRLLSDHSIEDRIRFVRANPSDVFVLRGHNIRIYQEHSRLVEEFQTTFPREAVQIKSFFDYMAKTHPLQLFVDLKRKTFSELLDACFSDTALKSALSIPLGNIALPSTRASALTAVFLYREFIFDGGYYPIGGMQRLADVLAERIREYGGTVLLLTPAKEIHIANGRVTGVSIRLNGRKDVRIDTELVVANCDPYQLLGGLVSERNLNGARSRVRALLAREPSASSIMVHLGVNRELLGVARHECNVWYYPGRHVDDYYGAVQRGELALEQGFLFYSIPTMHDRSLLPKGKHSIQAIIGAPYKPREFWASNRLKETICEKVIHGIERFIPGISSWIEVCQVATPPTLVKYTSNYSGAMYGWASTREQVGFEVPGEVFGIHGLVMVGHWSDVPTGHSGIATVVASGRSVSRLVLRRQQRAVLS